MRSKTVVASFAGAALMLLSALGAHAEPLIVDPPVGAEELNLFADIAPGTHIRAGQRLGDHCLVTFVKIEKAGYLNRSEHGPYFVGNNVDEIDIACEPGITGVAYGGDNDPDLSQGDTATTWYIDGEAWVPELGSDKWHTKALQGAELIVILPGDSLFGTITEVQGATGLPEQGEPDKGNKLYLPAVSS